MVDENRPDIDLNTLGTGCITGCGAGCAQIIILMGLVAASGVQLARITPNSIPTGIKLLGFIMGLGIAVLVGYVTARKAPYSKMLHALIVGALALVFGILGMVLNPNTNAAREPLNILGFLLSLPMTLLGARWAISSEEPSNEA
jgi:hypothetical protein